MAVKIRMRRIGRTNRPYFRIVATDIRSPRDGRFLEILGQYDPLKQGVNYTLKTERVKYWLGVGAQVSDAVAVFLKKEGLIGGKRVKKAAAPKKKPEGAKKKKKA
ncbi:MAG: 30S ribosomal protein S16 [Candidatus Aureabacteria bacterium]|nr:30S ribosomal protein S16 [Candidatus Auribacterota bacterium]